MCGINGFNWEDSLLIKSMNDTINHRGPDDQGSYVDKNISLGHVRLSVVDLSEKGHGPLGLKIINNETKLLYKDEELIKADIIIVFNGEIYNFQEIRNEFKWVCESNSDTEIILRLYLEYGYDCVNKFNGMWAFAIYDKRKNVIFCSRDRLGVKPFFYYYNGKEIIFCSELKGILQAKRINNLENLNRDAIKLYFSLGYIPSPYSIYKDVFKLEASQNLIFDLDKKTIKKWFYFELPDYSPIYNKKELINLGRELLNDATRLRLIADVPVGAFLSGGLDSSSIVGTMKKFIDLKNLHTFSIGFDNKYDESKYIDLVKDYYNTRHHHYYYKEDDFENAIDTFVYIYDEPFGDYSGFPTNTVSEIARKLVTVVLSGDGGDEIFGGYKTYNLGKQMDILFKMPRLLRNLGSKIPAKKNLNTYSSLYLFREACKLSLYDAKYFYAKALENTDYKPAIYKQWTINKLEYCLKKGNNRLAEALRIYDLLFNTLPDNYLVKVDRASMMYALEVRSPFLDYRFVEFSQKIPTKWKVNVRKTKILMRKLIKDTVPKEIYTRGKQGFTPPLEEWIKDNKYDLLIKEAAETIKIIDPEIHAFYQQNVFKENNKRYTLYKIRLFLFEKWYKKWITNAK